MHFTAKERVWILTIVPKVRLLTIEIVVGTVPWDGLIFQDEQSTDFVHVIKADWKTKTHFIVSSTRGVKMKPMSLVAIFILFEKSAYAYEIPTPLKEIKVEVAVSESL